MPAEAPLWSVLEAEAKKAEADAKEAAVRNTLARFQPKGGVRHG